jgi:hypothetical protein
MRFSRLETASDNAISTRTLSFGCTVDTCVLLLQTELVCMAMPAAYPDGQFMPTQVLVRRVCADHREALSTFLRFQPTGVLPFVGAPEAVGCARLTAHVTVATDDAVVAVYWYLTGSFPMSQAGTTYLIPARSEIQGVSCAVGEARAGVWSAEVEAVCQACLVLVPPPTPQGGSPGFGPGQASPSRDRVGTERRTTHPMRVRSWLWGSAKASGWSPVVPGVAARRPRLRGTSELPAELGRAPLTWRDAAWTPVAR